MPDVRYARELGWLEVWDPLDRRWLEIRSTDAPPCWRRAAHVDKQRRRAAACETSNMNRVSHPRLNERSREEEHAF